MGEGGWTFHRTASFLDRGRGICGAVCAPASVWDGLEPDICGRLFCAGRELHLMTLTTSMMFLVLHCELYSWNLVASTTRCSSERVAVSISHAFACGDGLGAQVVADTLVFNLRERGWSIRFTVVRLFSSGLPQAFVAPAIILFWFPFARLSSGMRHFVFGRRWFREAMLVW